MSDWPSKAREFVDGIAISVAIVGRDERGELVVTACNNHFLQMTGGERADNQAFPIPFDTLIPDHVRLEFREKLQQCFASEGAQELEQAYDFRKDTQSWRLSLKPIRHANGGANVVEILVTGFDIAPKMHLTHEREVNASRYRAVVDSAYDAIVAIDQQHNITLFNRAAENLFGYTSAEVLGRPIETLLPEKFRAHHSRHVRQFADSPLTSLRQSTAPRMDESNSVYGQHRDGSIIPVEIAISKIDVDGVTEFTAVVRDITDRARQMALLKKQAVTDALTGLPNRREFLEFVDKVLGTDDVLSVFILDIDFFKKINDSYGHDIGDEVLRVLAKVGMSITHESNLFARWGGEEFVAALPGADADLVRRFAEELRQRIEQQDFEHAWHLKPIPFTVSIGVVTRAEGERDVDALMKRADRALYRAKKLGRNRVEVG
ncbi:PAS domain S-box/diguanylate cyclase (GGDEF) domain-containing protein [Burkholderia sp. Ch1-1]|uniref:sensor domain-containing diguanylate cyclase n=1 Tax=Paraburkholderia sp. USG1 TaxID=2952268 RepID=UPI0001D2316F|nr:sensor domain-containing diguanylate cyclase [Paraburkholderia sp. USG1]EIF35233.1 PAS domain S-box/diguanylate cyclase (GGDEF) domain-containing protein [Burkholderia sp. Ch1-1]MDR8401207.1 diguanylate cyclase [Paraburkholderia sp. USG1]